MTWSLLRTGRPYPTSLRVGEFWGIPFGGGRSYEFENSRLKKNIEIFRQPKKKKRTLIACQIFWLRLADRQNPLGVDTPHPWFGMSLSPSRLPPYYIFLLIFSLGPLKISINLPRTPKSWSPSKKSLLAITYCSYQSLIFVQFRYYKLFFIMYD